MSKKFEKSIASLTVEEFDLDTLALSQATIVDIKEVETEYGSRDCLILKDEKDEKVKLFLNQTSIDNLIDAYGAESAVWTGKLINVRCVKASRGQYKGKMLIVEPLAAQKV